MIVSKNPYTQEALENFSFLSEKELAAELNLVADTFTSWSVSPLEDRIKLFKIFKSLLLEKKERLALLISNEMGKPLLEALAEIEKSATLVDYFVLNAPTFLTPKKQTDSTYISYHPSGAVFGIMPWNFPFWQVFRYAIPNMLAGNVCILKHAPNVFGCAKAIEQLFLDAGFPKNVFTNLTIDIPQVESVIAHKAIQGVCVTGSTRAGSSVAALAGKYLKKSILELGGTDAFAILKDADLKDALNNAFTSRLKNGGQVCIAAKRIFIPKDEINTAVTILTKKINELVLGNPLDKTTNIGPIAKDEFLPILQQQVEDFVTNGAKLIVGGKIAAPFYPPTLLVVNPENPVLQEEVFGPVLCLIPYEEENTLIDQINNTDYGLGAAVWSKDIEKATTMASLIQAGHVAINSVVVSDPKLPFGGVKNSGYGKELGEEGFKSFLNAKTVVIKTK